MKKNGIAMLLVFINVLCSFSQEWELVWADEFNYTGKPDTSKWNYETGYIRNQELQYYTKNEDNAFVRDSMLEITAKKEPFKGYEYTSASLTTENRAYWKYGRLEIKAKLPGGKGTWPAIWMLGKNRPEVGWPECGEIDIMENVGYNPNTIHANVHTEAYNHVKGTAKGDKITVADPDDIFHVYAVEWFPERIDFFVNHQKYFSFENELKSWKEWPFDQPFYLIINLAVGGAWGGLQGVNSSAFPQKYYIDYVRVYKQK